MRVTVEQDWDVNDLVAFVKDSESPYDVWFEDDGRVAYAYLRKHDEIVGDVWLYNSGPTPEKAEWSDPAKLPFTNPQEFVSDEPIPRVVQPEDISVRWIRQGSELKAAEVFVKGELCAILAPGSKPGWSRAATRPGPLAKPLTFFGGLDDPLGTRSR